MSKDKPDPRLELIQTIGNTQVWLVDGWVVRDHWFLDFTEGGNDEVYKTWLPKNEIWIEERNQDEGRFILLHEVHEHNKMKGEGMGYENAHISANRVEARARKNPSEVEALLAIEIKKFCELDHSDVKDTRAIRDRAYRLDKLYNNVDKEQD